MQIKKTSTQISKWNLWYYEADVLSNHSNLCFSLIVVPNDSMLLKIFYSKLLSAPVAQSTGFRMEKVVTVSLKIGKFGKTAKRIVWRRALIFYE